MPPLVHPHPPLRQRGRSALAVVLIYACFAALWILLSDHVVERLFPDPQAFLLASTLKGWAFVALTSALLYGLLRRRSPAAPASATAAAPASLAPALLVLGIGVSAAVALSVWRSIADEREQVAAQLRTVSHSKAREIEDWLVERLRDAEWAQKSRGLQEAWLRWRDGRQPGATQQLRTFITNFLVHDQLYARIDIVDSEGWRRFSTRAAGEGGEAVPPALVEPGLHRAVLNALTADQPLHHGPWRDADGQLWFSLVAPLAAPSHRPAAVVLHHAIGADLHPTLGVWPLPQRSAEFVLVRVEDDELVVLNELRHAPGSALRQRIPLHESEGLLQRLALGQAPADQLLEGRDYRGVPVFAVGQRIEGADWWLLAKQDRAELLQPVLVRSAWLVLTATLALLAVGTALYFYNEHRRYIDSQRKLQELERIEHSLRESEAHYRLLTENSTDVVWLYDLQTDRYVYTSPSVLQQLGYTPLQMQELRIEDVVPPELAPALREALTQRLQAFAAGDESRRTATDEIAVRRRDGHLVPLEIVSTLLPDANGHVTRILGISRDISARKRTETQLLQLSQAVEQSPSAVIITDLDGRIEYVNPAFERISGYAREEVLGRKTSLLRSDKTPRELYAQLWATIGAGGIWSGELVNRRKDGSEYMQSMSIAPVRDGKGRVAHYVAVQMDVTAQREAERRAHQLAWFSQLTGLPNRHRLLVELDNAQRHYERTGHEAMLLLLNLDRFQTVNDALGHAAGDQLLREVGARLRTQLQGDDMLAHLSADEFAILLHGRGDREAASTHALRFAAEVHAQLDPPFDLGRRESIKVSCCIGITPVQLHAGDSPGEALRRADTALHRAKRIGPRQTALFDASMEALISRRFAIEQDLRRGLAADELRLYLQPQVNPQGHMVSAEALVRWQHPQQGLLAPGSFIPIAEESELIVEVGRWVLRAVCRTLGELRRAGQRLPLAVNVSPRHFHQPDFVREVQEQLQRHDASPEDLVIEVTEGTMLEQADSVVQKMAALNTLGVSFSLDDFGTGYSSLAYLKRLPIHEIKIDRSFVQDAPSDPNDAALVEAMLSVARHLRLRVVAEGVETREQADFLTTRAELLLQGYLYGRPEPADALLARWLAQPPAA
ncbi:MAG: EAL domain-containing protein [Hylemonella sp.]